MHHIYFTAMPDGAGLAAELASFLPQQLTIRIVAGSRTGRGSAPRHCRRGGHA